MSCPEKDASVHKSIAVSIFKRYKAQGQNKADMESSICCSCLFYKTHPTNLMRESNPPQSDSSSGARLWAKKIMLGVIAVRVFSLSSSSYKTPRLLPTVKSAIGSFVWFAVRVFHGSRISGLPFFIMEKKLRTLRESATASVFPV